MSTLPLWVQLYYFHNNNKYEKKDDPIPFNVAEVNYGGIIAGLTELTKEKAKPNLDHCAASGLKVYPPGTAVPIQEGVPHLPLDTPVSDYSKETKLATLAHPLILLAPAPAAAAQNGQPLLSEEVIAKMENSVCVLIEEGKTFGSGFAVSNSRVYTAAHHWEEEDDEGATYFAVAVGDNVECIHGKPSANKRYNLQVAKLDKHLDYCILEIIGDHTFAEWLETDVSPNVALTTPVFLAAYQIGIQERLDEYEMGVTLGITSGTIVRRGNRHVVHSCASFKSDSGGAIVISNGKVIGLHIAAVNEAKELLDVTSVDFGSVADSINQLCDAQSSGSIALLVSAIEP